MTSFAYVSLSLGASGLWAQEPAAVLVEADPPVVVVGTAGTRLQAPDSLVSLTPGDSIVVGPEGFALLLYSTGPIRVWPGETHVVVAPMAEGTRSSNATGVWQRISSTVAALVDTPETTPAEPRHGVSRADGSAGVRLLVADGASVLSPNPRFFAVADSGVVAAIAVKVFDDLDSRRCWRGGRVRWQGEVTDSSVVVGGAEVSLEAGGLYRIEATAADGEQDTACFRVADGDVAARLEKGRDEIATASADAPESADLLWAFMLMSEGFDVDALAVAHDVLERDTENRVAESLSLSIRRRILSETP